MNLNSAQKDTLLRIFSNSGETLDLCDYSPKELAPHVSAANVSKFFLRLEQAGYIERLYSDGGRAFAVQLTEDGAEVALIRKGELVGLLAGLSKDHFRYDYSP